MQLNDSLDALICEKCTAQVDKVHAFIDNARLLDETHFKASRLLDDCGRFFQQNIHRQSKTYDLIYFSDDNKLPVCRCCLSTTRLVGITEEEPDLVSLLLKITGIDVSTCRNVLNSWNNNLILGSRYKRESPDLLEVQKNFKTS